MHRERIDGEVRVERAEAVDVVNHGEKERRGEGGVLGEAVEVVEDGDSGGGSKKGGLGSVSVSFLRCSKVIRFVYKVGWGRTGNGNG